MVTLEKYNGTSSRHTCPACGHRKRFSRYIDTETGHYLDDHVGRCDRESSCGYHFKPKDYFAEMHLTTPDYRWQAKRTYNADPSGILITRPKRKIRSELNCKQRLPIKKPDFLEPAHLFRTLTNYDSNKFVQFLLGLFPGDSQSVWQAVSTYMIGTNARGETIFWLVDPKRRIRTGKIMLFDVLTGKRQNVRSWTDTATGERRNLKVYWVHKELKLESFELQQCFFGEHLLTSFPDLPIAITEAEKSAVIGSICKGVFPDFVWLACGGKSPLNADNLQRLGRGRTIILYPDADGFDKWQSVASDARKRGMKVNVSDLIEKRATDAEKANKCDLADYLIALQQDRNRCNALIEEINANPARLAEFQERQTRMIEPAKIILGLDDRDASEYVRSTEFIREAVRLYELQYK